MCLGVVVRPLQLPCGQICCTTCLCKWVKHTITLNPLLCPCCPLAHSVLESQLHPVPPVMMKLLDTVLVLCRRCLQAVAGPRHFAHLESECKVHISLPDEPNQHSCCSLNILFTPTDPDYTNSWKDKVCVYLVAINKHKVITFFSQVHG